MIITRNWLNEWVNLSTKTTEEICIALNKIGLEVASTRHFGMPEGCVAGYVVKKEAHPNAEKLSVCKVDIGTDSLLQIVCGAKNVAENQWVAVALIGCVMGDGSTIDETYLRGVKSEGMLCSSAELGYPKTNEGIFILDNNRKELRCGMRLIAIPEFREDDVIEIELTPNRGDCLSVYGVARDLGAFFNVKAKEPFIHFQEDAAEANIDDFLTLSAQNTDISCIYEVLNMRELKHSAIMDLRLAMIESPAKTLLEKHLAYAVHTTGVLLRAYKKDAFNVEDVAAEQEEQKEPQRVKIELKKDDFGFDSVFGKEKLSTVGVWQSDNSKPSDENETLIIEASFIDPYVLGHANARSAKEFDWALFKALRGSEINLDFGINYLNLLLDSTSKFVKLRGDKRVTKEYATKHIDVEFEDMLSIIGMELNKTDVAAILQNLGFGVAFKAQNSLTIGVPSFRHDIANIQDICEEVVRIVGIDNIRSIPLKFAETNRMNAVYKNFEKKKFYRYRAAAAGFFENVSYVFSDRILQESCGFESVAQNLELTNPITNELNTLRTSCLINLAIAAENNLKAGKKSVSLFEVGKIFDANRNEKVVLSFISSGEAEAANPANHGKPKEYDFASFSGKISSVIGDFEIVPDILVKRFFSPFECGRIIKNGKDIGVIGRVAVEDEFDIKKTYVCEIELDGLSLERKLVKPYSKLPSVSRDLSLLVPKDLSFSDIKKCLDERAPKSLKSFYPIDIYEDESIGDKKSLTMSLVFEPEEKTFTDEEINSAVEQVLESLLIMLKITIR